jgi:hypothetical protein
MPEAKLSCFPARNARSAGEESFAAGIAVQAFEAQPVSGLDLATRFRVRSRVLKHKQEQQGQSVRSVQAIATLGRSIRNGSVEMSAPPATRRPTTPRHHYRFVDRARSNAAQIAARTMFA